MEPVLIALKFLVPLAYLATTAIYARLFFSPEEIRFAKKASLGLSVSLALHTLLLLALGAHLHRCPLGTIGEGLLFMAWILGVIHLISERLADTRRLGLFTLLPTAFCVAAGVFLVRPDFALPPELHGSFLVFHIVASLASYACFCMAAILSSLYLVLHGKLKHKNFDITFRKLPPLDKLDKLSANWSFLGGATMVLSSIIGWIWVRKDGLAGMSWRETTIYLVLAVYLCAGASRRPFGLRGKRFAVVVLAGFLVLVLSNLVGTHGFHR
ncbi:MAG TPA: cytochrome c biogenesis protein CcsA [Fibrobacteria bacterium]|nr:cytochrome c biogenesis protein CcsA [Fibrobacteria bacterium]